MPLSHLTWLGNMEGVKAYPGGLLESLAVLTFFTFVDSLSTGSPPKCGPPIFNPADLPPSICSSTIGSPPGTLRLLAPLGTLRLLSYTSRVRLLATSER